MSSGRVSVLAGPELKAAWKSVLTQMLPFQVRSR
jgi:hypothetical protein